MALKRFGFGRREKLKSRKEIDALFLKGKSFSQFPVRVTYRFDASQDPGVQVGVTAGKKHFKKAVDRNRIKRLLREAYRLQKEELLASVARQGKKGYLFFVYTDKVIHPFVTIREAVRKSLERLQKIAEANESTS